MSSPKQAGEDPSEHSAEVDSDSISPTERVQELLDAARMDEPVDPHLTALAEYEHDDLEQVRTDRETALAFWINLYNAGTQLLISRRSDLYESSLRTVRFFGATCVTVAGTELSLDDIEHGILRSSKSKYGAGYLPRVFSNPLEDRYSLETVDTRIHFACNCGAASCPAIRYYEPETVDDRLDLATETYLDSTVEYDESADVVRVPRVFLWYRGDFGGGSGIRELLRAHELIPEDASPRIKHQSWDWSKTVDNFA